MKSAGEDSGDDGVEGKGKGRKWKDVTDQVVKGVTRANVKPRMWKDRHKAIVDKSEMTAEEIKKAEAEEERAETEKFKKEKEWLEAKYDARCKRNRARGPQ